MINELENNVIENTQDSNVEENQSDNTQSNENLSNKEYNFKIIREEAKQHKARAEEAERRLRELEEIVKNNMQNNSQPKQQIELVDDFDINDDTYLDGRQFKKYIGSIKKQLEETQKEVQYHKTYTQASQAESRLSSQYKDFSNVVTKENLEKLATSKPHLYKSIFANQDIYDRGATAYEILKYSGIAVDPYEEENKRLETNRNKPRSAAGSSAQTSDTPLTRVGDYDRRVLSEERKAEIRRHLAQVKAMPR